MGSADRVGLSDHHPVAFDLQVDPVRFFQVQVGIHRLVDGVQLEAIDPASFTDANNKDPALRGRPIQGMQILALRQTQNPFYYEGEIYNPEDGNIYSGSVEVLNADLIRLRGCVLYVLCQEQDWSRVLTEPAPIPEQ